MIRSAIKSTTLSLAVEGIARVMLSAVKNNPGKRAYQLGLIAFGSGPNDIDCPDHKNMLTWAALCELEKRGEIRRFHGINWCAVDLDTENELSDLMTIAESDHRLAADALKRRDEIIATLPKLRHAVFYSLV